MNTLQTQGGPSFVASLKTRLSWAPAPILNSALFIAGFRCGPRLSKPAAEYSSINSKRTVFNGRLNKGGGSLSATRSAIFGLVCLAAVFPLTGRAEFITHPLDQAPPAQPAETSATPSSQTPPPVQPSQTDMQAQFGAKKLGTCSMTYKLEGFSLAYKQYDGSGEISCRNGEKAKVSLSSKSIGFTIGYSKIEGEGYFTDVKYLSEIYGDYISLGNHFGFKNSIDRQVLTRGEISLVLIGKGQGFDIGFTIGDLSIKPK